MTENQTFIYDSIFNQVRMGFISISDIKENIIEEIEDNGFEEELSEEWAYKTIEKEYNNVLAERENWPKPTDTEKLISAFDMLSKNNIIALHNAGYTTNDGEYEVIEVERSLREHQMTSNGYCFYHEQDLARAIDSDHPSLYIAFQKVDNSDDDITLNVGKKVVKVLTESGLTVDWNEDVNSKILIPNFQWQHLYNENNRDLQDYTQNLELMLNRNGSEAIVENNTPSSETDNNNSLWSKLKNVWS